MHSTYKDTMFSPTAFIRAIDSTIAAIEEIIAIGVPRDSVQLVCCGTSGVAITPIVAAMMNLPYAIIRKADENSHGFSIEESIPANPKHIFRIMLDDFVSYGHTLKYIHECHPINFTVLYARSSATTLGAILTRFGDDLPEWAEEIANLPIHPTDEKLSLSEKGWILRWMDTIGISGTETATA